MSINSNDTIANRTRDLPACSAVPRPTACPLLWIDYWKKNAKNRLWKRREALSRNFLGRRTVTRTDTHICAVNHRFIFKQYLLLLKTRYKFPLFQKAIIWHKLKIMIKRQELYIWHFSWKGGTENSCMFYILAETEIKCEIFNHALNKTYSSCGTLM